MNGPGLPEERQGETSGALPRKASRRGPDYDPYVGAGAPAKPDVAYAAPKRRGGAGSRLWPYWANAVVPVCFKMHCFTLPGRPQFNANVKHLLEVEGLTEEIIMEMIDAFVARISAGSISVVGKPVWGVFMRTWPKLTGRASDMGLSAAIEGRTLTNNEDWT